ncbi:MAG: pyridoxamine 5'-phosphate oxidase [Planctomycetaceae bacterium]|nr:pyridoxamine 5'-phosphate oxidase [Planctomycetaceae bacterium]
MEDFRKQYGALPRLERSDLDSDPIEQFRTWFDQATESVPVDWFESNAMTLATASQIGEVTARIVLLKGLDSDGLVFYTNYDSQKGVQLAENPRAAAVLFWPHLERQVRVEGRVERVSREMSERYFHSRPRGSQIGAAISKQSQTIETADELEQRVEEMEQQYADQPIPLPDDWGGFLLKPNRFEFWQGRQNRLHVRFAYEQVGSIWNISRLSP